MYTEGSIIFIDEHVYRQSSFLHFPILLPGLTLRVNCIHSYYSPQIHNGEHLHVKYQTEWSQHMLHVVISGVKRNIEKVLGCTASLYTSKYTHAITFVQQMANLWLKFYNIYIIYLQI